MQFFEAMTIRRLSDADIGTSAMTLGSIKDRILYRDFDELAPEVSNHKKPFSVIQIPIPRTQTTPQ